MRRCGRSQSYGWSSPTYRRRNSKKKRRKSSSKSSRRPHWFFEYSGIRSLSQNYAQTCSRRRFRLKSGSISRPFRHISQSINASAFRLRRPRSTAYTRRNYRSSKKTSFARPNGSCSTCSFKRWFSRYDFYRTRRLSLVGLSLSINSYGSPYYGNSATNLSNLTPSANLSKNNGSG